MTKTELYKLEQQIEELKKQVGLFTGTYNEIIYKIKIALEDAPD
jgi:hypothetical protein